MCSKNAAFMIPLILGTSLARFGDTVEFGQNGQTNGRTNASPRPLDAVSVPTNLPRLPKTSPTVAKLLEKTQKSGNQKPPSNWLLFPSLLSLASSALRLAQCAQPQHTGNCTLLSHQNFYYSRLIDIVGSDAGFFRYRGESYEVRFISSRWSVRFFCRVS